MTNAIPANSLIDGVLHMKFESPIEISEVMYSLGRIFQFCAATSAADAGTSNASKAAAETSALQADNQLGTEFDKLWGRFNELQQAASAIRLQFAEWRAKTEQTIPLEQAQDVLLQPIEDEMKKLAWRCSKLASKRPNDVLVKASILKALADDEPEELVSKLTRSLCDDIAPTSLKANGRPTDLGILRLPLDALDQLRAALDMAIEDGNISASEVLLGAVRAVANAIDLIKQSDD